MLESLGKRPRSPKLIWAEIYTQPQFSDTDIDVVHACNRLVINSLDVPVTNGSRRPLQGTFFCFFGDLFRRNLRIGTMVKSRRVIRRLPRRSACADVRWHLSRAS